MNQVQDTMFPKSKYMDLDTRASGLILFALRINIERIGKIFFYNQNWEDL